MKTTDPKNIKDYKVGTRILYCNLRHQNHQREAIISEFSDSGEYVCLEYASDKTNDWYNVKDIIIFDTLKDKPSKDVEDFIKKEAEQFAKEEALFQKYDKMSYEQKVADAIEEECRMTEEDYDKIDWDQWMKENSEEFKNEKPKTLEFYPTQPSEDSCSYFLEIHNEETWKLCLKNNFSVPKFGWSGHPYTLGEGKIAHESKIDMYTLRNLKRIVDGLNLLYAKDHAPFPPTTFETSKEKVDWNKPVSTGDPIVSPTIPYTTSNPMPYTISTKCSDEWTPMFNNTPSKHSSFPK